MTGTERDAGSGGRSSPRSWLALGLSATGLLTIVFSGMGSPITRIPVTAEFGLFQLLPPSYWVGLSLMGLAVGLALWMRSSALLAATGVLFFATFAGTPNVFEPFPRYWDAYIHLSSAQDITILGQLPTSPELYSANWPGFFLFAHILSALGAIAPLDLLLILPFITGGLTFLALFVFLRSIFPPPVPALASVLGSLLSVWAQFHLSPQSIGLFLALLVLATVWRKGTGWRAASAILFVGLVVIHPTSTIILLGIFVIHAVIVQVGRLRGSSSTQSPGGSRFLYSPALAFGVLWVGWLFFMAVGSSQVAETTILARIGGILQLPEETIAVASARSLGNVFLLASSIRLASLLLYAVVGIGALILLIRVTKYRRLTQFLWAALISLTVFGLADILAFEGLLYDRSLAWLALVLPAICLTAISARKIRRPLRRGILALFIVASLAAASTAYYQEAFNFVSDESAAVSVFLERAEPESLVLDGLFPVAIWISPEERVPRTDLGFFEVYPIPFDEFVAGSVYAVFDPTAELWYVQWRGIDIYQFYEADRSDFSLIYANGHADIHLIKTADAGE